MRRTALLAAAIGGLVVSSSFAGFTISHTVTSVDATYDQVDIFALNTGGDTGTGLLAVEIAVAADAGDVAYFRSTSAGAPNLTNTSETANRSFIRIDNEDASTTSLVSRTPAGNWPLVPAIGASTVGIEDFSVTVAGLAGAKPANTGAGALFATLFVSKGYGAAVTGNVGGEVGSKIPFSFNIGGPVNTAPEIASVVDAAVNFGSLVSTPLPFSATVNATDAQAADVLSLVAGTLPAGVTIGSITGGGTSPEQFVISGTVAYPGSNTTLVVPFTVSDGSLSTSGSFNIVVTPEPTALGALALGGMILGRRRK